MEEFSEDDNLYLSLCNPPIKFEAVSQITNVFYDDCNQQVFAVRSGGSTGVVVKGPKENLNCSFVMEDKGPILSIKFSPDQKILAVQRSSHSVEFINFKNGNENITSQEYAQSCKNTKNGNIILAFLWISNNEIIFITKIGLELFQVYSEKRMLKYIKNVSITIDWFLHSPETNTLVISSGRNIIHFQLRPGNIYKYPKLMIDTASLPATANKSSSSSQPQGISERDVSIVTLYNQTAVLILRHKPKSSTSSGAEVDVYILKKDDVTIKNHVLKLNTSGKFAINVIDNVIIVHHQASKTSLLFDIRLTGQFDGLAVFHKPVVVPMPIKTFKLKLPSNTIGESSEINCDLYSDNWVVFQPNVIIDAKLGCLWFLELQIEPVKNLLQNRLRLIEFLLQRVNGKKYLLAFLKNTILVPSSDLTLVSGAFEILNENYASFIKVELQSQMALPYSGKSEILVSKGVILVDQQDMYTNIFSNFSNCKDISEEYTVFVITEYIRTLTDNQIQVQHFIYALLINAMVRQKKYYQLHQFLQNFVVADSKHLACLLLSLEGVYPAALQLALDMMKRLAIANDLIVEILLSKQKIIPALRFLQSAGKGESASARKFLDAALKTEDANIFFSVYKYFEERNLRQRGVIHFEPSDMCDIYVQNFSNLFGKDTST